MHAIGDDDDDVRVDSCVFSPGPDPGRPRMAIRHSSVAPRRRRDARNGKGVGAPRARFWHADSDARDRGNVHDESAPSRSHQDQGGSTYGGAMPSTHPHSPTPNAAASFVRRATASKVATGEARPATIPVTTSHLAPRAIVVV